MISIIKTEVFRDSLTGYHYSKVYAFRPIAVLSAGGNPAHQGILLKRYSFETTGPEEFELPLTSNEAKLGYPARCLGQEILVTDDILATRFVNIGILEHEVDFLAEIAYYEAEECDFSNRPWVARLVARFLKRERVVGQHSCLIYTLLKDYVANTPQLVQDPSNPDALTRAIEVLTLPHP